MEEILIKKYDNRRLYCVEEARYVSLSEIKEFLQSGKKIKVIEKSSGKDITKYILMQVLLEDRYELLPTYFYQMVLQSPKGVVENFFQQFFPWMMDYYKNYMQNNSFPNMGFQNPWMSSGGMSGNNPFFNNPFMPGAAGDKKKTAGKKQSEPQKKSKKEQSKDKEEAGEDQMTEVLKRLKELEEKLKTQE
ncbi:MAG: polyhydroxyalkanoate synthesis regulator DNA-binding domain-containing protein [Candidatus Rifleibacteriota bacterium]